MGARLLPQSSTNLSEGADRVGGQLRGDKECPFSGVTKSGRARRKVPESVQWMKMPESVQWRKAPESVQWRKVPENVQWRKVPESDAQSVPIRLTGR